eukprot:gene14745-16369_t
MLLRQTLRSHTEFARSLLNQKRFGGGGGGRPGGKPTFNWKQKIELGLVKTEKVKKTPLNLTGRYVELKDHVNPTSGDLIIDFAKNADGLKEAQAHFHSLNNPQPRLNLTSLYGSNKSYGFLPKKPRKKPFSHKRIFGPRANAIGVEQKEAKKKVVLDVDGK